METQYLLISRTIAKRSVHTNAKNIVRCSRCVASNHVRMVSILGIGVVKQRSFRYFALQIRGNNKLKQRYELVHEDVELQWFKEFLH